MLLPLMLAEVSLLAAPLYLDETPELRSVQHILIVHEDVEGASSSVRLTREAAVEQALDLLARIRSGADFEELAYIHSMAPDARRGAMLGTFSPGTLRPELDSFLFSAEIGDFSGLLETPSGFRILKRVQTWAAVRQIFVEGAGVESRQRCQEILAELEAGAEFAEIARQRSDDVESGKRGGQYQVFQRGHADRLLKKAAFELEIGQIDGPIESPLGLHILQRVKVEEIDRSLRESKWIRASAILVAFKGAEGGDLLVQRTEETALELATELLARIHKGEDLGRVAADFNDDPGGRRRRGDLGWVHRDSPAVSRAILQLFTRRVGQVVGPMRTPQGYLIMRRDA